MLNAVVYCRISQDRTGEGVGVAQQEQDGRDLAKLRGWEVVAVKVDNDVSAKGQKKRPGFIEALAMIAAEQAKVIVAWDWTRLERNRRDGLRLIETCEKASATIALVRGSDIDMSTPSGRLVADMLSGVARHEIDVKGDRIRRARERDALAGKFHGGIRPFGYEKDGVTVVPAEAIEIVKATAAIVAGASLRSVTKALNDSGVATTPGNAWSTIEVRDMLRRARNAGLSVYRGEVVGKAVWPAIVPEESWRAVDAILSDPMRRTTPGNRVKWLGSGIYRCGGEGCTETMICSKSGPTRKPCYRCRTRKHITRALEPVDEFVQEVIIERLSRDDALDLLDDGQSEDVAPLQVEALALRQRLDSQVRMHARGAIDDRQLIIGSEEIRTSLLGVEERIAAAGQGSVFHGVVGTEDPRATWFGLELGRQRAVLDALMAVTILPAPHGRGPSGAYFDPRYVRVEPKR